MPAEDIEISVDEFVHQVAYENLHPGADYRMEFMLAQLTACFVQANSRKGTRVKVGDFMLSELMKDKFRAPPNLEDKIRATFSLFPKKE